MIRKNREKSSFVIYKILNIKVKCTYNAKNFLFFLAVHDDIKRDLHIR